MDDDVGQPVTGQDRVHQDDDRQERERGDPVASDVVERDSGRSVVDQREREQRGHQPGIPDLDGRQDEQDHDDDEDARVAAG